MSTLRHTAILFFLSFCVLHVISNGAHCQTTFERHISLGGNGAAYPIFEDKDGGYYCGLYNYFIDAIDPMIARLHPNGQIDWIRRINENSTVGNILSIEVAPNFDSGAVFLVSGYNNAKPI